MEFVGAKGIEREIMATYQRLAPMSEEKAKFGYIQLTKSLKTYLYTFFRVVVCREDGWEVILITHLYH